MLQNIFSDLENLKKRNLLTSLNRNPAVKKRITRSQNFSKRILHIKQAIKKAENVRAKFNIPTRAFNMRDFFSICKSEDIIVSRKKMKVRGLYAHHITYNFKFIYLQRRLKKPYLLLVAFHELGHHFLHQDRLNPILFNNETVSNPLIELQADIFSICLLKGEGSYFFPKSGGVKC